MACMAWQCTEEESSEVVIMLPMYESDQADRQKYLHLYKTQHLMRVCLVIKALSMIREQLMMESGTTLVIRPSTGAPEDLKMLNVNLLTCYFMKNCQPSF